MKARSLVLCAACGLLLVPVAYGGERRPRRARRPRQYKRTHFTPMKLLLAGKAREAAQWCEDDARANPTDTETLYCLAIAQAQLGEADQAVATVKKAAAAGLSLGRFVAGPRGLVKPLVAAPAFQELLKTQGAALVHGPLLGCVTDRSARFWVRTAAAAAVQIAVVPKGAKEGHKAVQSPVARTRAEADFTAVAEVKGLAPDTAYQYAVALDGKPAPAGEPPVFRTYPPAGKAAKFLVGFGGGAGFVPPHERMWDTIRKHAPLAFLLLGDNVYIDTPTIPGIQRYCYYRRQSRPEFRRLTAATSVYAIWDDHDFGTNDCIPGPLIDEPAWKVPVWRVFCQNWNNPAYGGGATQPGCWFDLSIGDVDFFLTDSRFYRTDPRKGDPATHSMLGPAQRAWLLERLGASKATFKVLINGVPWSKGTKGGSRDTWDGFPAEREAIFSFINTRKIDGVFLLAADRHRSDVWKTDRPKGYPLYEFESSRLTNQHVHGRMPGALFSYNAKQSCGLLHFDTTAADPTVTYEIISIDDESIHKTTLTRSQLQHPR